MATALATKHPGWSKFSTGLDRGIPRWGLPRNPPKAECCHGAFRVIGKRAHSDLDKHGIVL